MIDSLIKSATIDSYVEETEVREYKIALYASLVANAVLFVLQLTSAILSGSLALFATAADAFMDLASTLVLIVAGRMSSKQDFVRYPAGKSRFKTIGIILFATLMSTLSLQLVSESAQSLAAGYRALKIDFYVIALIAFSIGNCSPVDHREERQF